MQRLFNATSSQLGLARTEVTGENQKPLTVFPIELLGMPADKVFGIRRLRWTCKTTINRAEHFLSAERQIHGSQGNSWYKYLGDQLLKKRTEGLQLRRGGQPCIPTYENLRAQAMELQGLVGANQLVYEKEPEAMEEGEQAEMQSGDEAGNEDQQFLPDAPSSSGLKREVVEDPTAAMRLAVGDDLPSEANRKRQAAAGPKRAQRAKKGRKVKEEGTGPEDEDEAEDGEANSVDWEAFKERDPEMHEIALKHLEVTGKVSGCFHVLTVARFLRNERLGQAANGAPCLHGQEVLIS